MESKQDFNFQESELEVEINFEDKKDDISNEFKDASSIVDEIKEKIENIEKSHIENEKSQDVDDEDTIVENDVMSIFEYFRKKKFLNYFGKSDRFLHFSDKCKNYYNEICFDFEDLWSCFENAVGKQHVKITCLLVVLLNILSIFTIFSNYRLQSMFEDKINSHHEMLNDHHESLYHLLKNNYINLSDQCNDFKVSHPFNNSEM